jgi:DNA polymerase III subunit epsilon
MSGESTTMSSMPRFVVIDVETSGLSARRDRILQIAAVEVDASGAVTSEWSTYVRPRFGRVGPTHVHGLTSASLRSAPAFRVVAAELAKQLDGAVVVGHNIDFDWAFVRRSLRRSRVPLAPTARLCTLDLSRSLDPDRVLRHKLAEVCDRYGVELDHAHDALADARATALILPHLLTEAGLTSEELTSHRAFRSTTNPGRPRRKKRRWWRRRKRQR